MEEAHVDMARSCLSSAWLDSQTLETTAPPPVSSSSVENLYAGLMDRHLRLHRTPGNRDRCGFAIRFTLQRPRPNHSAAGPSSVFGRGAKLRMARSLSFILTPAGEWGAHCDISGIWRH